MTWWTDDAEMEEEKVSGDPASGSGPLPDRGM
jgi:hypothetical protein